MGRSCTTLTFSYTINYPGSHLGLGWATRSCRPKFLFKPILRTQITNVLYNRLRYKAGNWALESQAL